MFHMPLNTPMEITTAEDTGRAFAKALVNFDKLEGSIFNLGGVKIAESNIINFYHFLSIYTDSVKFVFPGLLLLQKTFIVLIMPMEMT